MDYGWRLTPDTSGAYARAAPRIDFTPDARASRWTLGDRLPGLEPSILPDKLYQLSDDVSDDVFKTPVEAAISEIIEIPVEQIAALRESSEEKDRRRKSKLAK